MPINQSIASQTTLNPPADPGQTWQRRPFEVTVIADFSSRLATFVPGTPEASHDSAARQRLAAEGRSGTWRRAEVAYGGRWLGDVVLHPDYARKLVYLS